MRIHLRTLLFLAFLCAGSYLRAQQPAIIPQPVSTTWADGHFLIDKNTVLVADVSEASSTGFFNVYLEQVYGLRLPVVTPGQQPGSNYIRLTSATPRVNVTDIPESGRLASEGHYNLQVSAQAITINGATHSGTFYGIQTLIQLLPVSPYTVLSSGPAVRAVGGLSIPMVYIEDYPRFGYRGMHLDVGRHFFPVDFIKKYIDYIALHKM